MQFAHHFVAISKCCGCGSGKDGTHDAVTSMVYAECYRSTAAYFTVHSNDKLNSRLNILLQFDGMVAQRSRSGDEDEEEEEANCQTDAPLFTSSGNENKMVMTMR